MLDEAVREILAAPEAGVAREGDLSGVFVHKFELNRQEALLSYQFSASTVVLLSIGSHENCYRDLKR
ncbi:hypothetical protein AWB71_04193 [Caballeronia peredens]|nr:hypothetical protein AWB71_04193 [Caballeronia peredens]